MITCYGKGRFSFGQLEVIKKYPSIKTDGRVFLYDDGRDMLIVSGDTREGRELSWRIGKDCNPIRFCRELIKEKRW